MSSLHAAAVTGFVQHGAFEDVGERERDDLPRLRTLRVGIHVSLGARQAVRSVGAALGMEIPMVISVARQEPLPSSPGAIDNVMTHAPELGIADARAGVEPYNTLLRVAGQVEGFPHRYGAHPSAYTFSFYGPGALAWLPAQWLSDGHPSSRRAFGAARHLAVVAQERAQAAGLAHQAAVAANVQTPTGLLEFDGGADGETNGLGDLTNNGGPVIALQCDKADLESLGLERLDISPSATMATAATLPASVESDPATAAAAWRLLEVGDTLSISQIETVGVRMLLKRARELVELQSAGGRAVQSIEDLAQLLVSRHDRSPPTRIRLWPRYSIAPPARCCTPISWWSL